MAPLTYRPKRTQVQEAYCRAERVIAKNTKRTIFVLLVFNSVACTIQKQTTININIMTKKTETKQTEPKSRFKSKWNFTPQGETNNGISETVEGEAYTIQELLQKHVNGIMPPVGLNPLYDHDEPTHEDDVTLRKPDLDLTDIDDMKIKVKKAQATLKKKEAPKNTDRMSEGESEATKAKRSKTSTSEAQAIEETEG